MRWLTKFAAFGGALWGVAAAADGQEEALAVPSGQTIALHEMIEETQPSGAVWTRWRFVAPAIGDGLGYEDVADDFMHLCHSLALPKISGTGEIPEQIIISFADRPTAFGEATPEVTQFFEAFRVADGRCIWEAF